MDNKAHSGGGISLFMHSHRTAIELREHSHSYHQVNVFKEYSHGKWWWHCKRIDAIVSWELNLTISETVFRYNSAEFGGATYTSFIYRVIF